MIRNLFVVAGSAFLLCLLSFAGVAAFGGFDIRNNSWTISEDDDGVSIRRDVEEETPAATRDLAWTGGQRLEVALLGDVVFTQADEPSIRVTGPQDMVDMVEIENGRLALGGSVVRSTRTISFGDRSNGEGDPDKLTIHVSAPDVREFRLSNAGDLEIRNYDHDELSVVVSSLGDVRVSGRADLVRADVSGAGDIDLSDLAVREAEMTVSSLGSITAGPTERAEIELSGAGDVNLTSRPRVLSQNVSGLGEVRQQ